MADLDWLVPPKTAAEFADVEKRFNAHMEELFLRTQVFATATRTRIANPKSGSKWAQKTAFLRIDLRWYARYITRPLSGSGAAYIAAGKAMRTSFSRYVELQAETKRRVGGGVNLD